MQSAPVAIHLRVRKNAENDLEFRGSWAAIRGLSAYVVTIANIYGGRLRGPTVLELDNEEEEEK